MRIGCSIGQTSCRIESGQRGGLRIQPCSPDPLHLCEAQRTR